MINVFGLICFNSPMRCQKKSSHVSIIQNNMFGTLYDLQNRVCNWFIGDLAGRDHVYSHKVLRRMMILVLPFLT